MYNVNSMFKELKKKNIKLFIYTHVPNLYNILPYLDNSLLYNYLSHNSDHSLNQKTL
jgi:hypothetical protein